MWTTNNPVSSLEKRDFFVSRIISGFYKIKLEKAILLIFPANNTIEYEASELFNDVYDDACLSGLITLEQSYEILKEKEIWTDRNEEDLEKAPTNIDILKMELYRAAFKTDTRDRIRKHLEITKTEYDRLLTLKNSLQQYTCSGLASYAKWNYIIENTTYTEDKQKYNWKDYSVHNILNLYNAQILNPSQIRLISHTDPWYAIWGFKKKNGTIFQEPWTVEQKSLISWSSLYDNVYECHDCPSQSVIDDDDMLDGWLIIKRKERERDQVTKQGEDAISQNKKIAEAGEIFIPVRDTKTGKVNINDILAVDNLNDSQAKSIKQMRLEQIQEQGSVKHGHFKDVQFDLQLKARQFQLEQARKK